MLADLPDHPATSLEQAVEREQMFRAEILRLRGKAAELDKQRVLEKLRANAREQQILDLGRLLKKHKIDWRAEVVWTDPTAPPP